MFSHTGLATKINEFYDASNHPANDSALQKLSVTESGDSSSCDSMDLLAEKSHVKGVLIALDAETMLYVLRA